MDSFDIVFDKKIFFMLILLFFNYLCNFLLKQEGFMIEFSDILKKCSIAALCISGILLIGYLGYKVVRWLLDLSSGTQKIDETASTILSFVPKHSLDLATRRFDHLDTLNNKENVLTSDIEAGYRRCFQIATRALYQPFTQSTGQACILAHNAADGFGDHNHGVAVTNQIVRDFPEVTASQYTFFFQKLDKLPALARPKLPAECSFFPEYPSETDEELTDIKEKIQQSACVLDVSYSTTRKDIGLDAVRQEPKYSYIREYGSNCYSYDPAHTFAMGLRDLDEGIFFKEIPSRPLFELHDDRIKNILFETTDPTQEHVETYRQQHSLHLFYHKLDCFYQVSDLYITAELHKNDEKTIDVLIPLFSLEWLTKMKILDLEVLENLGIGSLRIVGKDKEEVVKVSETGKEMRIIHPGFLPQEDFYNLMSNCEEPFGCTGDQSFSDALSHGVLLHYELRGVKWELFNALKQISEKLSCPLVKSYMEATQELFDGRTESLEKEEFYYREYEANLIKKMSKKIAPASHVIASLIQNKDFKIQWEKVVEYLRQNCDISSNIQGIVARHLAFYHFPELVKIEEEFYTQFRIGEKTIEEVHNELANIIQQLDISKISA